MKLKKYWNFKNKSDELDFMYLHPFLMIVLSEMTHFCDKEKVPFVITSMIREEEENKQSGAVSRTHIEGRAVDLRIHGWKEDQIQIFTDYFTKKYNKEYGAISAKTLEPNLIYIHGDGKNRHFHIQVRRI